MERLLKNPSPKYYLGAGEKAYAATDNAHGGEIFCGTVVGAAGESGYRFRYLSPDNPGVVLEQPLPAENLFPDMASVETTRKNDRSVQDRAVRNACSTPEKLVAFLLGRAGLPEGELEIVVEQARALGLTGKLPIAKSCRQPGAGGEMLDVYDDDMNKTGSEPRSKVHAESLRHMTVRVWMFQDGMAVFQERAHDKDLFPGKLDPLCTGHVLAGECPAEAALREIFEETGVKAYPDELMPAGAISFPFTRPDGSLDDEFANLFVWVPKGKPDLKPTKEVARWIRIAPNDYGAMAGGTSKSAQIRIDGRMAVVLADEFCHASPDEWELIRLLGERGGYIPKTGNPSGPCAGHGKSV